MSSNKTCKFFERAVFSLLFWALNFAFCVFAVPARASPLADAAGVFLRELETPEPARRALLEKIREGETRVVEIPTGVYGFSAGKAPVGREAYVQKKLEAARASLHAFRARHDLMVYLTRERIDRARYPDNEALGSALSSYYGERGIAGLQSASESSGGWVMALVWLTPEAAEAVREDTPEAGSLDGEYCSLLYARAKALFDAGGYTEALPVFKHIHDFRWANVGAYLDAAECFLRTEESGETLKLLKEVTETLGSDMDSDAFERAGVLFLEAGDREVALSAFRMARERFRQGR